MLQKWKGLSLSLVALVIAISVQSSTSKEELARRKRQFWGVDTEPNLFAEEDGSPYGEVSAPTSTSNPMQYGYGNQEESQEAQQEENVDDEEEFNRVRGRRQEDDGDDGVDEDIGTAPAGGDETETGGSEKDFDEGGWMRAVRRRGFGSSNDFLISGVNDNEPAEPTEAITADDDDNFVAVRSRRGEKMDITYPQYDMEYDDYPASAYGMYRSDLSPISEAQPGRNEAVPEYSLGNYWGSVGGLEVGNPQPSSAWRPADTAASRRRQNKAQTEGKVDPEKLEEELILDPIRKTTTTARSATNRNPYAYSQRQGRYRPTSRTSTTQRPFYPSRVPAYSRDQLRKLKQPGILMRSRSNGNAGVRRYQPSYTVTSPDDFSEMNNELFRRRRSAMQKSPAYLEPVDYVYDYEPIVSRPIRRFLPSALRRRIPGRLIRRVVRPYRMPLLRRPPVLINRQAARPRWARNQPKLVVLPVQTPSPATPPPTSAPSSSTSKPETFPTSDQTTVRSTIPTTKSSGGKTTEENTSTDVSLSEEETTEK